MTLLVTPGSGATMNTDDIAGVKSPVSKLQLGAAGVDGGLVGPSNPMPAQGYAGTSGGSTNYSYIAAASANQDSQVIKASAGQIYSGQLYNTAASVRYVKIYDKATTPTSADTPVKRHMIPAGGGVVINLSVGEVFASGIAFRITTGIADNDTGAVTANDVIVNVNYK